MNHLTSWADLPDDAWHTCLQRARHHRQSREWTDAAAQKTLALLFLNPSLRTRASMELAAQHLGAASVTLTPGSDSWGLAWDDAPMTGTAAEHVREAIPVLGSYADAIGIRTFAGLTDYDADYTDAALGAVVEASSVPVVNLESARWHPCQELADAAALTETFGDPRGKKLVLSWAPHPKPLPHAVGNSALLMAARLGMEVVVARPEGFDLAPDVMDLARDAARKAGGSVTESGDQALAFEGAHAVYAKSWADDLIYDDPVAEARRREAHAHWRVTYDLMRRTDRAHFMHCLPVRRGVVVDAEVLEDDRAIHLLQAEYRLHAQKAILEWVWGLGGSGVPGTGT
ncbi:MAG: N-acetylornithine carbamoyltransferase [Bacteroidota bacterium]